MHIRRTRCMVIENWSCIGLILSRQVARPWSGTGVQACCRIQGVPGHAYPPRHPSAAGRKCRRRPARRCPARLCGRTRRWRIQRGWRLRQQAPAQGAAPFRQQGGRATDRADQSAHRRPGTGLAVRELLPQHARHHCGNRHPQRQAGHLRHHRRHPRDVAARFVRAGAPVRATGQARPGVAAHVPWPDSAPGRMHHARPVCQRLPARWPDAAPEVVAQRHHRDEARRGRAQVGSGFAVLPHPHRARILARHRRRRTVRRRLARGDARGGQDLPRAAAQGQPWPVRVPAPVAAGHRNAGTGRLRPADQTQRHDPLDVPPFRRRLRIPAVRAGQFVRGHLATATGGDEHGLASRHRLRRRVHRARR